MQLVELDTFAHLLPALQNGMGDLVAANLTRTPYREEIVSFTAPVDRMFEMLVLAPGQEVPESPENLQGRLGIRAGSSFERTADELRGSNPGLEIVKFPGEISAEAILDSVAAGSLGFTLIDSNRLTMFLTYRQDFQVGPPVTPERFLAWAVRQDSSELREALNSFLYVNRTLGDGTDYVADLPEIKKKRRIRMITRNNDATYFLWRGRLMGFEYEMAKRFADRHDLELEVVVAPTHADLLPMLRSGQGDFVAALLTPTADRADSLATFSGPKRHPSQGLVLKSTDKPMDGPADLAGRSIAVRRSSTYCKTLEDIRKLEGIDFEIVAVPENVETEAIIIGVAEGRYDLTVADSNLLELEMSLRDDLQGLFQVKEAAPRAWAVQPGNVELLAAINAFFEDEYQSEFYNVTYSRYFDRSPKYEAGWEDEGSAGRLSPYDDLVMDYADQYGFDWRLVVAQMYQESRFDPKARSWAGAVGLMQIMPETAEYLGVEDLEDPGVSIETGVRYLRWVWERYSNRLDFDEHMWFTLAGYNAGQGHVYDARRLAEKMGLDPDVWFGNAEVAMLKLSEPEYHNEARHGYVRGTEPVDYVRKIRARYQAYVHLLEEE
jgi:membrane-bound lytic murein transglycosylase F